MRNLSIVFLLLALLGAGPAAAAGPPSPLAEGGAYGPDTNFSVVLTPRKEAVLSTEVRAPVARIHKEFGQSFTTGQVLVEMDPRLYRLNLQKAEAVAESAHAFYEITRHLHSTNSASTVDLERARMEAVVAEVAKKAAQKDLESCRILAPFAGRVEKVAVNEHELVEAGRPLMKIVADGALRAHIILPAGLINQVKLGQKLRILVKELGQEVSASVTHVSAVLDPASATFEIYAEAPNQGMLRSGMSGRLAGLEGEGR